MPNAKSLANLIPPKKGEVRNPMGHNGRERKRKLEEAIDAGTLDEVVRALVAEAKDGNVQAATTIIKMVYSAPGASVDLGSTGATELRFSWADATPAAKPDAEEKKASA